MSTGKTYSTKYLLDSNNNRGSEGQILSTTSTGIDWVDANSVPGTGLWVTSGNSIYNSNSGNVGIGTTSPAKQLVVRSSAPWIRIEEDSASNKRLDLWVDPTSAIGYIGANQSAQQLSFQTGSSDRIRILNNGNVGIGTTAPGAKLVISGGGGAISDNGFQINSSYGFNGTGVLEINPSATSHIPLSILSKNGQTANLVNVTSFGGTAGNLFNVQSSGNVGIGTDSPTARLDILTNSATGNGDIDKHIRFRADNGEQRFNFKVGQSGNAANLGMYDGDEVQKVKIDTNGDSYFNGGNVGIGTTSPDGKLDVAQNMTAGTTTAFTSPHLSLTALNATDNTGFVGMTFATSDNVNYGWSWGALRTNGGLGDMVLRNHYNSAQGTEKMRILANGNVGIGTASPVEKLQVDGKAFINGQIYGGFGAKTTTGTLDWNDSTNARSGNGHTLLRGNATNGPAGNEYYHPFSWEYGSYDNDGNMTQFAIPYSTNNTGMYYRSRYSGTWNDWAEIVTTTKTLPGGPYLPLSAGASYPLTGDLYLKTASNQGNLFFGTADANYKIFGGGTYGYMGYNTGGYHRFLTSGVEKMRIDSSGNVGIGTTSPNYNLDIENASSGAGIRLKRADTGDSLILLEGSSYGYLRNTTGPLGLGGANGERDVLIDNNGNVGIGTTSPSNPLHVYSSDNILATFESTDGISEIRIKDDTKYTRLLTVGGHFKIMPNDGVEMAVFEGDTGRTLFNAGNVGIGTTSPNYKLASYSSGDEFAIVAGAGNAVGEFTGIGLSGYIATNAAVKAGLVFERETSWGIGKMHFLNNNTLGDSDATLSDSKMTIDSGGNVGIGTTNPSAFGKFVVSGSGNLLNLNATSGKVYQAFYENGAGRFYLNTLDGSDGLAFTDADGATERMRIDSDGNVGIGTTAPGEKLVIAGGVLAYGDTSSIGSGTSYYLGNNPNSRDIVFTRVANAELGIGRYNGGWYETMRFDSAGNVGIGTTSPQSGGGSAKWLSLNGTAAYSGGIVYTVNSATKAYSYFESDYLKQQAQSGFGQKFIVNGTTTAMTILSDGNATFSGNVAVNGTNVTVANASNPYIYINDTNAGAGIFQQEGNTTRIGSDSNTQVVLVQNNATAVTIDTDKNVGINTTSPDFKLDVDGTFGVSDLPFNTDSVSVLVADETIGADLVTNGDFATNTDWTEQGGAAAWSIANGKANCVVNSSTRYFEQPNVLPSSGPGNTYKVVYTISGITQGQFQINIGGYGATPGRTTNGTYAETFTTTSALSNNRIYLQSSPNTIGSIDNISVQLVTSASNQIQKRELGTGAFGPTPVGAYLPLSAGSGEILTGDLAMNNNIGIITKDSSGAFRDILKLNSSNVLEIGSSSLATDTIFKNSGNVGIGTTSPGALLDVDGDIRADRFVDRGNPSTYLMDLADTSKVNHLKVNSTFGTLNFLADNYGYVLEQSTTKANPITFRFDNDRYRIYSGSSGEALTVLRNRNVGIRQTNPTYNLDVTGNGRFTSTVTATNFILSSDERLKENVEKVCNNKVKADWKTFELKTEKGQRRYGVIAQELEKTNPEFVREDSQGFKSVAYIDLLIAKIAELEARLEKLEK